MANKTRPLDRCDIRIDQPTAFAAFRSLALTMTLREFLVFTAAATFNESGFLARGIFNLTPDNSIRSRALSHFLSHQSTFVEAFFV